jgi:16S rRNA processing protein RimM
MRFEDMVTIGRVAKPQGRKGEILVEALSDRPGRFPALRRAWVPGTAQQAREVAVERCWPHKGRFVLKLAGVDSIDAAEAYRGLELRIPLDDLEPLPPGCFYHHELIGLAAQDEAGRSHGRVEAIWDTGAGAPVLVLRGAAGEQLLPLLEGFVKSVDTAAGRIVIAVPEPVEAP